MWDVYEKNNSSLKEPHPPLIVISLDGYAKTYLSTKLQLTFDTMAKCGVSAEVLTFHISLHRQILTQSP